MVGEFVSELDKVEENILWKYRQLLGEDWPEEDFLNLLLAKVDWDDLENLLKANCPPKIAIQILL